MVSQRQFEVVVFAKPEHRSTQSAKLRAKIQCSHGNEGTQGLCKTSLRLREGNKILDGEASELFLRLFVTLHQCEA